MAKPHTHTSGACPDNGGKYSNKRDGLWGESTLYINKEQLISNSVSISGAKAMASYTLSRLIRISAQLFACDFP